MIENNDTFEEIQYLMKSWGEGWKEAEEKEREMFLKAYEFAKEVHKNQVRDEGTPYISHIDGIIDIMKNELNDANLYKYTIIALHDVIEDSDYTYEDLVSMFNKVTADVVMVLTKEKGTDIQQYLSKIENSEFSATAIKIKLCDRLHNVRSLKNILETDRDKVLKYIEETEKYYLPFAEKHNEILFKKLSFEISNLKEQLR